MFVRSQNIQIDAKLFQYFSQSSLVATNPVYVYQRGRCRADLLKARCSKKKTRVDMNAVKEEESLINW